MAVGETLGACYELADVTARYLLRPLRALMFALVMLGSTGLGAALAASFHDHEAECVGCDASCPGSCDPHDCPPGPLCRCAPQAAVAVRVVFACAVTLTTRPPPFVIDTRVPGELPSEGIFHPPRAVA